MPRGKNSLPQDNKRGCEMCAGGVPAKNDTNLMNAAGHCTLVVADLKLIQDKVIKTYVI